MFLLNGLNGVNVGITLRLFLLRQEKELIMMQIKTGRWLADKHPKVTSPEQWTRQLAIKFVADETK